MDNPDLWSRISKQDDLNAFKSLHAMYYAQLCDFVFSYLKTKELCEEVISDVFFNIWHKRTELKDIRNIKSYLYTCSRNHSIDQIRKNSIRIQPDICCTEIEISDPDSELTKQIESTEFKKNIQLAMEQLPPQCRLIFKMLINDQLSYKEISQILELSRKTVEAQVLIAYKKLTVTLKNVYVK